MRHVMVAATALLLLAGCNKNPYYNAPLDLSTNSVTMDAKQRVVLVGMRDGKRIVCAEPSPDALSAFASSIAANANLSADTLGSIAAPSVGGGVSTANAEQAAYIGARNATIQMLRDGLYRACEAYLNETLDEFGYAVILANYGRLMGGLLMVEGLTRPQPTPPVIIGASAAGTDGKSTTSSTATPASVTVQVPPAQDAAAITALSKALETNALPLFASRVPVGGTPAGGKPEPIDIDTLLTACLLVKHESSVAGPRQRFCDAIMAGFAGELAKHLP